MLIAFTGCRKEDLPDGRRPPPNLQWARTGCGEYQWFWGVSGREDCRRAGDGGLDLDTIDTCRSKVRTRNLKVFLKALLFTTCTSGTHVSRV